MALEEEEIRDTQQERVPSATAACIFLAEAQRNAASGPRNTGPNAPVGAASRIAGPPTAG